MQQFLGEYCIFIIAIIVVNQLIGFNLFQFYLKQIKLRCKYLALPDSILWPIRNHRIFPHRSTVRG